MRQSLTAVLVWLTVILHASSSLSNVEAGVNHTVRTILGRRQLHHNRLRIPAETEPHTRTYLAWPGQTTRQWAGTQAYYIGVRNEIANIAKAVSNFEPVVVLVNPDRVKEAENALHPEILNSRITLLEVPVDDVWARDFLPIFATTLKDKSLVGVDTNYFIIWAGRFHGNDALSAEALTKDLEISRIVAPFRAEGGAFTFDGEGTLLMVQSTIFNPNRNPEYKNREDLDRALKATLGLGKVIWFSGIYNSKDVTDFHVDALARFVRPGLVVLSLPPKGLNNTICPTCAAEAESVLRKETDAKGRPFQLAYIHEPNPEKVWKTPPFLLSPVIVPVYSYVNFVIVNGGVIVPQFGDEEADLEAVECLRRLFPERYVIGAPAIHLGTGGGALHCVTKHEPASF